MTPDIWIKGDEGWKPSRSKGFENEAALHQLIEQNPDMLPLSGVPKLVILGSEVMLGSGYADILGVESSGRPVIIEAKMSWNPESHGGVVSQILWYAAHLHGMTREQLEDRLSRSLYEAGYETIPDAVKASDQTGAFDQEQFTDALDDHLREGSFRLVFLLDNVPQDLMTLAAYLDHVTDKLAIDLIAVGAFDVNGTLAIVPHRVILERHAGESTEGPTATGKTSPGGGEFEAGIHDARQEEKEKLRRLLKWARDLEAQGTITLATYRGGVNGVTISLLPYVRSEDAGLITGWNDSGRASVSFWRSVFERKAPDFIDQVEKVVGSPVGQGTVTYDISDDLLDVLAKAYEHAAR